MKILPKCNYKHCAESICENDTIIMDTRAPKYCETHSKLLDSYLRDEDVSAIRAFYEDAGFWSEGEGYELA